MKHKKIRVEIDNENIKYMEGALHLKTTFIELQSPCASLLAPTLRLKKMITQSLLSMQLYFSKKDNVSNTGIEKQKQLSYDSIGKDENNMNIPLSFYITGIDTDEFERTINELLCGGCALKEGKYSLNRIDMTHIEIHEWEKLAEELINGFFSISQVMN